MSKGSMEEDEEPARDRGEGPGAWPWTDSEPVPITPLCAMYRGRDFARS